MNRIKDGESEDLKEAVTMNMLKELASLDKINEETLEIYRTKLNRIHNALSQSHSNNPKLFQKSDELRKRLNQEKVQESNATHVKNQNALIVKHLTNVSRKARQELTELNTDVEAMEDKLSKQQENLDLGKAVLGSYLRKVEDEIAQAEKIYQKSIDATRSNIKSTEDNINDEKKRNATQEALKKQLELRKTALFEEHEKVRVALVKVQEIPDRLMKKTKNIEDSIKQLQQTLEENQTKIREKDKKLEHDRGVIENLRKKVNDIQAHNEADKIKKESTKRKFDSLEGEHTNLEFDKDHLTDTKAKNAVEFLTLQAESKRKVETINTLRMDIDQRKKKIKRLEHKRNEHKDLIREGEMSTHKVQKENAETQNKLKKMTDDIEELLCEQKLLADKKTVLDAKDKESHEVIESLQEKIQQEEANLAKMKETEASAINSIKNLTALRENMARRASGALAEVRQTREELKIKELMILDLTKKQQEIEFKLNSFKTLYEEVKSARNKYVNDIQNSSQELAELKQRIKISQNELEILKNDSTEKDKSLLKLLATTKAEIHERDKKLGALNKAEFEKQQLIEQGNQQANEIAKLNMITVSLQQDMLEIRKHYEDACEKRNHMGVQLIDRNDELCILYEKTNIQESIIKNGEAEIVKLEDQIRMIKIEIDEVQRRIEATRRRAPEMPKLAITIKQLNEELNSELAREEKLSDELIKIENKNRFRDLPGEDPDPEALKAKIQVLEERLNSMKEALLEKELILDEVTNISDNLRTQSIEERLETLQDTSKINDLQARLKNITRKMMATISELSMFQANVIKLEAEKNELYSYMQNIKERVEQGIPPTDESEIDFIKILRDKKRYLEQREERMEQEMIRGSMEPFKVNSTAEPRPNKYIDEIGLPKPYGHFRPFRPSELGSNMRHYRQPEDRPVEI